jgi:hypothetical protein
MVANLNPRGGTPPEDHFPFIGRSDEMAEGTCACGGSCSCGGEHAHAEEVYLTKEEYVERLELYLKDLKAEIQAVEAELAGLRQPV